MEGSREGPGLILKALVARLKARFCYKALSVEFSAAQKAAEVLKWAGNL